MLLCSLKRQEEPGVVRRHKTVFTDLLQELP